MKLLMKLLWYYLETRYTKVLHLFGIHKDNNTIPEGVYCYEPIEPFTDKGYSIKICPYHRSTKKTKGIACTYIGYYGFDFCLYDYCKICGEKC